MAPIDIEVGRAYVVNFGAAGRGNGLQIALCVGKAKDGDVLLKARTGLEKSSRWHARVRRMTALCVRREASDREVQVNMAIGPVPAAAS